MLRTLWMFIYFFGYLVYLTPIAIRLNKLEKEERTQEQNLLLHQTASTWGRRILQQTGSEVDVCGSENIPDGPVLFISNHQGYFDIPLLLGYIDKPKGFIAKEELKGVPLFGSWIARIRSVFIDRENIRQSLKAFQRATKIMKSGYSMVIFPEGKRSKSPKMDSFKPGSLKLATRSDVPIVPIAINGSYQILEGNKYIIKPREVSIKIFKPIYPDQLSKEEKSKLSETIHSQINSHLIFKNAYD